MSERIKIEVDDTELDAFIMKLNLVLQDVSASFGTRNISTGLNKAQRDIQTMGILTSGLLTNEQVKLLLGDGGRRLPAINREVRVLLNQIPGMNQYIRQYLNIVRLETGAMKGGMNLPIALIVTLLLSVQFLRTRQARMAKELAIIRTTFGDYFLDSADLETFTLANRLTALEKFTEAIYGWFSAYVWEKDQIKIDLNISDTVE